MGDRDKGLNNTGVGLFWEAVKCATIDDLEIVEKN